jgi:hypothetical protein
LLTVIASPEGHIVHEAFGVLVRQVVIDGPHAAVAVAEPLIHGSFGNTVVDAERLEEVPEAVQREARDTRPGSGSLEVVVETIGPD